MKNVLLKILIISLLLVPMRKGASQVKYDGYSQTNTEIYAPSDLIFKVKSKIKGNPFDITFGAVFTSPDGAACTIPGFYNGNQEYVVRFSPDRKGSWSYETYSSVPELSGIKSSLNAGENRNENVHGGIIIHPSKPRKFSWQDGTPYFALAFELDWLFALDYDNTAGIPKTSGIIAAVKDNGFNQVVMNVYAYNVNWKVDDNVPEKYNYKNPDYTPFIGSNDNPDFSSLNLAFFNHFDRVIHHLYEHGIVAHLMIYVWNKNVNWPAMYSDADNRYFDYIIKRYQGYPNIIWDVSKEALDYGRCDIPYINERIERIRKQDGHRRLITVHDYEYCSREASRVDFISIQNWRSGIYYLSLEAYQMHADKPVMNIEHGGYEEGPYLTFQGNYTSPEVCLLRNYECVFAGVYSTYYWQNTSWNVVIYDPFNAGHTLKKPRFDYYRHMQTLFTRYDFNELYPAKPKLTTNSLLGNDNMASSGYPLTNGKDLYLFYIPAENFQINVVLPEPDHGLFEVTWFNPFTGEFIEKGEQKWSTWAGFQSPWKDNPGVLILKLK